METATVAAGCFWQVEHSFRQVPGVIEVVSGYTGGTTPDPTYEQVCRGDTGHAEAVQVTFDPEQVSYKELLEVFWRIHDPTQRNRQGPDHGPQYRSAIFTHGEEQAATATASAHQRDASGLHRRPIVTEITPAGPFYRAEDYHQRFLERRGMRL